MTYLIALLKQIKWHGSRGKFLLQEGISVNEVEPPHLHLPPASQNALSNASPRGTGQPQEKHGWRQGYGTGKGN